MGFVVAAATVALFAPVAHASPETDATDAINAAWDSAGGDASTLGPRDGGLYPVGAGFGQNFVGGAIYFSPATGAKIMHGAILDKYRSLGGPADSDLGFPNIDEGPGRISPESRNSTFSAGDNPVIFWTPETGAWVVRGPINAAWDKIGGSAGPLGVPIADETYSADVVSQKFTGGQLSFDMRAKTFTTEPPDLASQLAGLNIPSDATSAINTAWRAAGGSSGPLGARAGEQYPIGDDGAGQDFAAGKVFYSPPTGAYAVTGDVLAKYESVGGPGGDFGFPIGSETDGGVPDSRVQAFSATDNPVVFWTKDHGAVIVRGAMKAAWDKLGGATGELGVPTEDQNSEGSITTQKFSGGQISWDSQNNTFTSDPANLAESLSGLQVPDAPAPSTPPAAPAPEKDNAFAWHNWWLWWIVPLAVLLLGSLYAWIAAGRRRAQARTGFDTSFDEEVIDDSGYDGGYAEPHEDGHWSRRRDFIDHDDEEGGYQPPSARTPYEKAESEGLFTHHGAHESDVDEDTEDPDAVDTAPTRVLAGDAGEPAGRHAAHEADDRRGSWSAPDDDYYLPAPGSLFAPVYGAAPPPESDYAHDSEGDAFDSRSGDDYEPENEEPVSEDEEFDDEKERAGAPPAIHLPLDDPHRAPEGYPVKGSMRTGRYHAPGSPGYDETVAEIWFASAELAESNGFSRAD